MASSIYSLTSHEKALIKQISLPLNHCNLPSELLASIAYQQYPIPLSLDGTDVWYSMLFDALNELDTPTERAHFFKAYMDSHFCLSDKKRNKGEPRPRSKVDYRRLLLGWLFDSDNAQGAAWRSWVESRFGLLTLFHKEPLIDPESEAYQRFRTLCAKATYNTNELYQQLDLLYSYCQLELAHQFPNRQHVTLYRGCGELPKHFLNSEPVMLFNNLSSFTSDAESALRFGTKVFEVKIPLTKIVSFDSLLPGSLSGEQEYMVIGGLYRVSKAIF